MFNYKKKIIYMHKSTIVRYACSQNNNKVLHKHLKVHEKYNSSLLSQPSLAMHIINAQYDTKT